MPTYSHDFAGRMKANLEAQRNSTAANSTQYQTLTDQIASLDSVMA